MPNPVLAAFVVISTLTLVAAVVLGYFAIRRRLMEDPDLQEFVERVEAGQAAEESHSAPD